MNYENAPATTLLATTCCCCGRPLLDAQSITAGIGPVCAEKWGYNETISEEARVEANKLVHQIAAAPQADTVPASIARILALGLVKLATILTERLANPVVAITEANGSYVFKTPYNPAFVSAIKAIPAAGRRFDPATKSWSVLAQFKAQAYRALCSTFQGETAVGPKGLFVVGAAPVVAQAVEAPVDFQAMYDAELASLTAEAEMAARSNRRHGVAVLNFTRRAGSYSRDRVAVAI